MEYFTFMVFVVMNIDFFAAYFVSSYMGESDQCHEFHEMNLKHWGLNKMVTILQMTF